MFIQQICKVTRLLFPCSFFAISLFFPRSFFPYSFFVRSLFVPYVFNGRSPADLADYADECSRAALFRRQKTVSANVSAKADAADNAEKDSYHIGNAVHVYTTNL